MGEAPNSGKRLGPYELLRKLGEGGMGAVYEAERKGDVLAGTMVQSILDLQDMPAEQAAPVQPGQRVALKLLRADLTSNREFVDRFWREAKIVTSLAHENIVRGLDAGQANGAYYFAMEFVEGRSVGKLLELEGALPEATAIEIILQVARGLQYAHEHQLIHRDIKPDNIMLTPAGNAKLADFGLARSVATERTQLTVAGQIMGTPYYIAPEQARAEDIDIRSDIYSLGATFYHMVTGKTPFEASSAIALITKCLSETPAPAHVKNSNVTETLSAVISKMMAKEPSDRYQTPAAVVAALEPLAVGANDNPELSISFMSMGEAGSVKQLMQRAAAREQDGRPSDQLTMPGPSQLKKQSTGTRKKMESTGGILKDPVLEKLPIVDKCKKLGNVILLEKLGQGGMGAVYRGRHVILDIDVAVKVMLFPPSMNDEQQEMLKQRFIREARIAIQLEHPGIVRTFEIGVDGPTGLTYIVMEFIAGKSAANLVEEAKLRGEKISEKLALDIVRQASEALASAHKMGVVHRDIKPGNLLVRDSDGVVKIADMGLAKSLGGEDSMQMTRSDSALGTPAYMAPEQAASAKDVGPASDIYALGATLYNLATGRVPFEGNSLFEVLSKVVSTPPPSICEQRPDITVNLERIAHKAMAKKAQDRYESAQAMAQDCARALEAIGAGSVVISSHRVLGLFEKRHIPTVLGAAGAVMALAIFIVLLLVLGQKPEEVIIEKMVPVAPVDEAKEDPEFAAAKAEIDAIAGLVKEGKLEDAYARAKLGADRFAGKPYANEFTQKASEVREATARAELDQVSRLTDEKKFDEAIRLAKAGADAYSDTTQAGQFRRRATEIRELHARSELDQILALQKSGDMSEALVRVKAASEQFADTTVASAIRQETRNIRQAQATKELEQIAALVDARKYDDAIGRANAGALAYADTLLAETFRERAASIGRLVQDNKRKADEVAQDRQRSAKHDRHIADGDSRLAAGDQLGALAAYNLAMGTLDTEDARRKIQSTRLALAEVEMKAARFEQALEQLLEAAKLVENPEVATRMNAAKRAIDARRHLDQATDQCRREEYDSAEQALTKARQTDPGYLTEAIASLEKRIADERSYRASLAQAREAYEKRAWSEIVESASKAIEVHPNDEQATKLLAEARRNIERPQETTNALGMAFRYVPGGTFQMGSSDGDPDEKPVRAVVLDQYYIGTHEVTNAQFEQYQPDHKKRRTGVSKDDTCPAANVSWLEAEAYCRWLTTRTGVKHRLPTEAEWEFAARGFDGRVYPWGNEAPKPADKRANWGEGKSAGAWAADGFAYTAPVGSFPAGQSPFGCMDMAGNVWEWVADWYGQYTATSASTVNPKGPRGGDTRVIRGGSWFHDGAHLRSANRSGKKPSVRVDLIGFRVVMEVEQ